MMLIRTGLVAVCAHILVLFFLSACDKESPDFSQIEKESRFEHELENAVDHGIMMYQSKNREDTYAIYRIQYITQNHGFFTGCAGKIGPVESQTLINESPEPMLSSIDWSHLPIESQPAQGSVFRIGYFRINNTNYAFVEIASTAWFIDHYETFLKFNEFTHNPSRGSPVWLLIEIEKS